MRAARANHQGVRTFSIFNSFKVSALFSFFNVAAVWYLLKESVFTHEVQLMHCKTQFSTTVVLVIFRSSVYIQ